MSKKYSFALIEVKSTSISSHLKNKKIQPVSDDFTLQLITKIEVVEGETRYNNPYRLGQYFTDKTCKLLCQYETLKEVGTFQEIFWNNYTEKQ